MTKEIKKNWRDLVAIQKNDNNEPESYRETKTYQ